MTVHILQIKLDQCIVREITFKNKKKGRVQSWTWYERIFWDYSRADKALINPDINIVEWEGLFANETVGSQVCELNDLIWNIYSNHIPNKTVLWDNKNPPLTTSHQRCSVKKVFLKILQNSQENTCARVSFLIKLQTAAWSDV